MVNFWRDTSETAKIWNGKKEEGGSLGVFQLRVMLRATIKKRHDKCYVKRDVK